MFLPGFQALTARVKPADDPRKKLSFGWCVVHVHLRHAHQGLERVRGAGKLHERGPRKRRRQRRAIAASLFAHHQVHAAGLNG